MFGVSGLRIDQSRRAGSSQWGIAVAYAVWSAIWIGGHLAGGAVTGSVLGAVGHWIPLSPAMAPWILAAILALGGLHHLGIFHLPMPQLHRQVPRRWMGWPPAWMAIGYGVQLGSAVSTRITNFATYAALAAAFLTRSPVQGAIAMMIFAFARALPAIFTGPIANSPQRSFALAFRVGEWEPRIHKFSGAVLLLCAVLLTAARGSWR
jgi:cytochrome c biogenesis protein CcdA